MRYEVKLVIDACDRQRLRAALQLGPQALRELHSPRWVQSIYFDTPDEASVAENLAGISERTKLRFRWYGEECQRSAGNLECKHRRDCLGEKDLLTIAAPVALCGALRSDFVRSLRGQLPLAQQELLDGRSPTQWIRYRREYFGDTTGHLRITIDEQMTAFDQTRAQRLQCHASTPLPALCILEAKAAMTDRADVEDWLQALGFRPGRCSKYVMACRPDDAPQPSRFCG